MSTLVASKWQNPDGTENYKCRAWVNFNGTGTVAIRAAGNVSSITDNGTGDYTINFTAPMVDANYAVVCQGALSSTGISNTTSTVTLSGSGTTPKTAAACRLWAKQASAVADNDLVDVAIFR